MQAATPSPKTDKSPRSIPAMPLILRIAATVILRVQILPSVSLNEGIFVFSFRCRGHKAVDNCDDIVGGKCLSEGNLEGFDGVWDAPEGAAQAVFPPPRHLFAAPRCRQSSA